MSLAFDPIMRACPLLLKGAVLTLQVLSMSAFLSLTVGLVLGLLLCERLRVPGISGLIEGVTFVLRAVPFYVQLLIVYFVIPDLLGFDLEPLTASVMALGLCSSGYVAHIFRGGMNGVSASHWEAALTLGFNKRQTVFYLILPQVVRHILPFINNEIEALLKSTSVVSSIGLLELTRMGMNIVSREMDPVPIYLGVAAMYLGMSAILSLVARGIERRLSYVRN